MAKIVADYGIGFAEGIWRKIKKLFGYADAEGSINAAKNQNAIKWRVENSWGDKGGNKGYNIMTDKWFDEYNYEIVVHKDYISDELKEIFESGEAIPLKPWDPMGALAK